MQTISCCAYSGRCEGGFSEQGLPPRTARVQGDGSDRSLEELSLAASKTMLGLKADQESLPARAALQVRPAPQDTALPWVQERQLSLVVAGLAEELTSGRLELEDDKAPIPATILTLQNKLARLISASQNYGKLKYEENLSRQEKYSEFIFNELKTFSVHTPFWISLYFSCSDNLTPCSCMLRVCCAAGRLY